MKLTKIRFRALPVAVAELRTFGATQAMSEDVFRWLRMTAWQMRYADEPSTRIFL